MRERDELDAAAAIAKIVAYAFLLMFLQSIGSRDAAFWNRFTATERRVEELQGAVNVLAAPCPRPCCAQTEAGK